MPDYRTLLDRTYLGSWDLPADKDTPVVVESVVAREFVDEGGGHTFEKPASYSGRGKIAKRPVAIFKGAKKAMILNSTNCKAIAAVYGTNTEAWIGKTINLFRAQVKAYGETKDAIRVRVTKESK